MKLNNGYYKIETVHFLTLEIMKIQHWHVLLETIHIGKYILNNQDK